MSSSGYCGWASRWPARSVSAAVLAAEHFRALTSLGTDPFGAGLHRLQYQMCDGHHRCSHGRELVVPPHSAGLVCRLRRGLVGEAATGPSARHSRFRSRLPIYIGRVSQFLAAHHITCSMSAVGSCADNAATESFFGVLKRERVSRRQCRTRVQARPDIFDCIERRHNLRQRRRLPVQQQGEQLLT